MNTFVAIQIVARIVNTFLPYIVLPLQVQGMHSTNCIHIGLSSIPLGLAVWPSVGLMLTLVGEVG